MRSAPTLKIWMTPLASVAMLEKLALLKIAFCRAPALSSVSSACSLDVALASLKGALRVLAVPFAVVMGGDCITGNWRSLFASAPVSGRAAGRGERSMEVAAATRGKFARAMAGADTIEIKATIADRRIREALARFGLTAGNDEERYIYFFDTPRLALLGAGIIARARRVVRGAHDSTIKFRPVQPADIARKWRRYRDFKVEADASEKDLVKSAS